ncbi:MAG TPA: ATP-binding protein, partial [Thermoanaerobaculia bacterium]|nr:ATP-binding protein [Thermoanaerobaculia bacterium]
MSRPAPPLRDLAPLLAGAAAPFLPPLAATALLLAALALWWRTGPPRRELLAAGSALLAAALLLAGGRVWEALPAAAPSQWRAEAEIGYRSLLAGLEERARAAAAALAAPPGSEEERLAAYRRLSELAGEGEDRPSFLLLDPDGEAVVWAGRGLLHEPAAGELPPQGIGFRAGFGAATLMAIEPVGGGGRPWRVVAGRSMATRRLPFDPPGGAPATEFRWSLVSTGDEAAPGAVRLGGDTGPTMVVSGPVAAPPVRPRWLVPVARGVVAVGLLALAVLRAIGLVLLAGTRVPPAHTRAAVAALAIGGSVVLALALGAPPPAAAALAVGLSLAAAGMLRSPAAGSLARSAGGGAAALMAAAGAALAYHLAVAPTDLGSSLWGGAEAMTLRLAMLAGTLGLVCLACCRSRRDQDEESDLAAVSAAVALLLAAAWHDYPAAALPLLAAGGGALGVWSQRVGWRGRVGALLALLLVVAVGAAAAWQAGERLALRRMVRHDLLPAMAPPGAGELGEQWRGVEEFFAGFDTHRLAPRQAAGLEAQDLAYVLWRQSPLARRDGFSAVAVELPGGGVVRFSYGLPLTGEGTVDPEPVRWAGVALPAWRELLLAGGDTLNDGGRPWARVRYWFLPRPGFRLGGEPLEDLRAGLLRGGPAAPGEAPGVPDPLLYGLYAADGTPLLSPWPEAPPLPAVLRQRPEARVRTPAGTAWAFARRGADGREVAFLPALGPGEGIEHAGTHALAVLLLLAGAALATLLLGLPRAAFRDALRRGVRSYSKRLLLVYGTLLLLPLLLLDLLLFQALQERLLTEQRTAGEAALRSAQQVLGEYVLSLEPGFAIETALDDELLEWLSRVVHHEVNLYWGSRINASSKRELFTAGMLPERIPGEIYSRLALLGYDLASRLDRAGGTSYLELYAPLAIPGVSRGPSRLFLSMPLLAQQEEAARELGDLERQGVLLTAFLFVLAAVFGSRLARGFTRPLQELVEGTRRIAAGAPSLELAPSELELAALVEAVDEMARRIDEGRRRLVREKQVVERMVENITSGIVSVDAAGRVLLSNRVAGELLGAEVGEPLREQVARRPGLEPVAEFLAAAGDQPREGTVRLAAQPPAGEEREFHLVWVPVPGSGAPAALLVVEDATEVLRAQRLQAWAEMARIIAHEIKNPLTPIRLSTEHMVEVYQRDPERFDAVFARCSANILAQVDELQEIAQEFSTYSRLPRVELQPGDLAATVAEIVDSYRAAPPPGVSLRLEAEPAVVPARFDARLIRRAVRNLLENAVRASAGRGEVAVRVTRDGNHASLSVADRGPGVPVDALPRIFD